MVRDKAMNRKPDKVPDRYPALQHITSKPLITAGRPTLELIAQVWRRSLDRQRIGRRVPENPLT